MGVFAPMSQNTMSSLMFLVNYFVLSVLFFYHLSVMFLINYVGLEANM
jgi:hypothetical protein